MIFKIKSEASPTLETIVFADVVINLFVFFFVTFGLFATFDAPQKGTLPIQLPKATNALTKKQPDPLAISIEPSGAIHLGTQKVSLSELQKSLNQELSLRKEKSVMLRADRTILLEQLVSVLDVIRNTKARAVAIETET